MKLSFSTLGCPKWDIDQIIENASGYGFDGVELRTNADGTHFPPDASTEQARSTAERFRDAGVHVMSVMGYTTFAHADQAQVAGNQEVLRGLIGIAHAMQAPYIRTFAGQIPEGSEREAMVETVAGAIRPLAQQAADKGITIGIETHDDWCAGDFVGKLLELVDSRGFGVVYDIFNSFVAGLEPWEVTYDKIKEHICYCHLKDAYIDAEDKHHYVFLGAGDLPVADVLSRFKADGYGSYFSFEWEKMWVPELEEPERVFPHYVHKIRKLWEAV